VLNPDVLFHHTNTQEEIDSARKYNAQFDGIGPSQLDGFAKLLATSKDKTRREISQHRDSPGRPSRAGDILTTILSSTTRFTIQASKVWQVCKIDGQWKILSVAWTIY